MQDHEKPRPGAGRVRCSDRPDYLTLGSAGVVRPQWGQAPAGGYLPESTSSTGTMVPSGTRQCSQHCRALGPRRGPNPVVVRYVSGARPASGAVASVATL